jgi:hypothetical protein
MCLYDLPCCWPTLNKMNVDRQVSNFTVSWLSTVFLRLIGLWFDVVRCMGTVIPWDRVGSVFGICATRLHGVINYKTCVCMTSCWWSKVPFLLKSENVSTMIITVIITKIRMINFQISLFHRAFLFIKFFLHQHMHFFLIQFCIVF